jgi:hypothetical protein
MPDARRSSGVEFYVSGFFGFRLGERVEQVVGAASAARPLFSLLIGVGANVELQPGRVDSTQLAQVMAGLRRKGH